MFLPKALTTIQFWNVWKIHEGREKEDPRVTSTEYKHAYYLGLVSLGGVKGSSLLHTSFILCCCRVKENES